MATLRLVDVDASFDFFTLGAVVNGDGIAPLDPIGYYFTGDVLATGSGFPQPEGTYSQIESKYPFYNKDIISIIPETGESVYPITIDASCDVSGFDINFEKGQIDTTTLCDMISTQRAGRTALTGSITGVFTSGTTGVAGGILNDFIAVVEQKDKATSTISFSPQLKATRYIKLTLTAEQDGAPSGVYFLPIELSSFTNGVSNGSSIAFTANWTITSDDIVAPAFFTNLTTA